jgi:hypothetical protein
MTELKAASPTTKPRRTPPLYCWTCRTRLAPRDYHYLIRWEGTPRVLCVSCLYKHDAWGLMYWMGNRAATAVQLGPEQDGAEWKAARRDHLTADERTT